MSSVQEVANNDAAQHASSALKFPNKTCWQSSHCVVVTVRGDDGARRSNRFDSTVVSSTADMRNGTPEAHLAWTGDISIVFISSLLLVSVFSLSRWRGTNMLEVKAHEGGALSNDTDAVDSVCDLEPPSLYTLANVNNDRGGC